MVFVDEVLAAKEPAGDEFGVVGRWGFIPFSVVGVVPFVGVGDGGDAVGEGHDGTVVEGLGVEAFPPFSLPSSLRRR